jgi:glycosyltransferase involved in cell wall biosynthesis
MPIFSVVTPVYDGGDTYLLEAYESMSSQRLPKGWALQWLVQEDGKTGKPLDRLPDKSWVSKGVGRAGGAARARTLALHRVEGVLVRAFDADDLLPDEHALARDVEVLAVNPNLGWTVAPALDLYPDGRIVPGPRTPDIVRLFMWCRGL